MRRILALALAHALSACSAQVLTVRDWRAAPPEAPCEVVETYTDGMGPYRSVSRYDAEGRLLFAETRLTYDGRGFEHVTWTKDRIARIESYYEQDFRQGNCDVIGGCDEPAARTIERTAYRYDAAGRLVRIENAKSTYGRRDEHWVERDTDDDERRYVYDDDQLVAIRGSDLGDITFEWENGHPVRRRFDGRTSTYEWSRGRLVMYRWFDYAQSFEYDAAGRLVREVLAGKSESADNPTITEWTYDAAGRVLSETRKTRTEERSTTWTYDARGRLLTAAQDGRVNRTFEYGAACPSNLRAVRVPSAETRSNLDVCIRSPGYGYDSCFYSMK